MIYHYTTYLQHCIGKPMSKKHYNKIKRKKPLEDILLTQYSVSWEYREIYLEWCESNKYIPYALSTFWKNKETTYKLYHNSYIDSSLDYTDIQYIARLGYKETEKKSIIDQNMILFYKNYFRRKFVKKM